MKKLYLVLPEDAAYLSYFVVAETAEEAVDAFRAVEINHEDYEQFYAIEVDMKDISVPCRVELMKAKSIYIEREEQYHENQ